MPGGAHLKLKSDTLAWTLSVHANGCQGWNILTNTGSAHTRKFSKAAIPRCRRKTHSSDLQQIQPPFSPRSGPLTWLNCSGSCYLDRHGLKSNQYCCTIVLKPSATVLTQVGQIRGCAITARLRCQVDLLLCHIAVTIPSLLKCSQIGPTSLQRRL